MRQMRNGVILVVLAAALAGCGKKDRPAANAPAPARLTQIGVNSYLWRAALDAIGFMPLAQVDSNGGVIITDWYVSPQSANERLKVIITVLDTELRSDALKVSVTREVLGATGWVQANVRAGTVQKLEETILTKARDLRRNSYNQG